MRIKSYAKVNLALDIVDKLPNGYHTLRTIMQTVDLYDDIEITAKSDEGIKIITDKSYIPDNEKNLAYKAAQILIDKYDIQGGVTISIKKNIPVAAGMGGGSSNAATVLSAMNIMYRLGIRTCELEEIGAGIGADVPFFIKGGTALCEGIGDKIIPIGSFKDHILVVIKPPFGISTKQIYDKVNVEKIIRHPRIDDMVRCIKKDSVYEVAPIMKNVMENIALHKYPMLKEIKADFLLHGALGSVMSGSGSTIFGMFDDMMCAQSMFLDYRDKYEEVFITRTL